MYYLINSMDHAYIIIERHFLQFMVNKAFMCKISFRQLEFQKQLAFQFNFLFHNLLLCCLPINIINFMNQISFLMQMRFYWKAFIHYSYHCKSNLIGLHFQLKALKTFKIHRHLKLLFQNNLRNYNRNTLQVH